MPKLLFKEEQRFKQSWLWVILIVTAILPLYGIYQQIILGKPFGNNPMSDGALIGFTIMLLILIGLFWFVRLRTEIDENGIRMQFFPLLKKNIQWNEIDSAKIVTYGFIGGWGIRLWTKYGTVYNMKGNRGLAIQFKNGQKFLIGSQKTDELQKVLDQLKLA